MSEANWAFALIPLDISCSEDFRGSSVKISISRIYRMLFGVFCTIIITTNKLMCQIKHCYYRFVFCFRSVYTLGSFILFNFFFLCLCLVHLFTVELLFWNACVPEKIPHRCGCKDGGRGEPVWRIWPNRLFKRSTCTILPENSPSVTREIRLSGDNQVRVVKFKLLIWFIRYIK